MPLQPPDGDQIDEATKALELHQADSKEPDEKVALVLGTIHWMQGNAEGREVGDYIASVIAREDQLNAKARDRAVDQGEVEPGDVE